MNTPTDADALSREALLLRRLILRRTRILPKIPIGRQSVVDIGRGHQGGSIGKDILPKGKITRRGGIDIGAGNDPLPERGVRSVKRRATETRWKEGAR
jgi:hypothetical protein